MPTRPFELQGRRNVAGGIALVFRCTECGNKISLFIDDRDELDQNYPVACSCGIEVNMYFGSPLVGKALLRKLRSQPEPQDSYRRSAKPQLN